MREVFYSLNARNAFAESVRFIIAGGLSFLVDIGSLALLQETIFWHVEKGLFVATAIAFAISLCFHYVLAAFWVFNNHNVSTRTKHAKAGFLFAVSNIIGLGINELVLLVGVSVMAFHYVPVKVVASAIVMVWNFACQKLLIFRKGE